MSASSTLPIPPHNLHEQIPQALGWGRAYPLTRRQWLTQQVVGVATLTPSVVALRWDGRGGRRGHAPAGRQEHAALAGRQAERLDPAPWQALAQRAVEAAHAEGAQYAEARLTRRICHAIDVLHTEFDFNEDFIGVGVRTLVHGAWGFSASAVCTSDEVVRVAKDAFAQAKSYAHGTLRPVELGPVPVARGSWTMPVRIDPFTVSIEEKLDVVDYWKWCLGRAGLAVHRNYPSRIHWLREERVVATSEGALFTQTGYESGGQIVVVKPKGGGLQGLFGGGGFFIYVHDIGVAGAGWERFLDAHIPEQCASGRLHHEITQLEAAGVKPMTIGKYTLVCDGATMAALVESTLGVVTQLDRALGYEANAGGTSWLDDPLGMLGSYQATSPLVTLTANRSLPQGLATVKWDDEGVAPEPFPILKDGVLVDFQTTREQAAWLAPYYEKAGRPVQSHGCAAAESAHFAPLQHMPNLVLEPGAAAVPLEALVEDVKEGLLVRDGAVLMVDSQARTGWLAGNGVQQMRMQEIRNGRLGKMVLGGVVLWDGVQLWKDVKGLGGQATQQTIGRSAHGLQDLALGNDTMDRFGWYLKGEPPQRTGHTIQAVAATIANQFVINPGSRG